MFYVKMVDKFLTGWGEAEGKVANYVIECETYDEAVIVAANAKHRKDMKKISIVTTKPRYKLSTNQVTYMDKYSGAANWFKKDWFKL